MFGLTGRSNYDQKRISREVVYKFIVFVSQKKLNKCSRKQERIGFGI